LIITSGFTPDYAHSNRSIAELVIIELADQGHYNGYIDRDVGPRTRHAIAPYQDDQRLRVTGLIINSFIASLGV